MKEGTTGTSSFTSFMFYYVLANCVDLYSGRSSNATHARSNLVKYASRSSFSSLNGGNFNAFIPAALCPFPLLLGFSSWAIMMLTSTERGYRLHDTMHVTNKIIMLMSKIFNYCFHSRNVRLTVCPRTTEDDDKANIVNSVTTTAIFRRYACMQLHTDTAL